MSIVKSFSVGNGDMFYIKHVSNNFTIIDCCLNTENREEIIDEIITEKTGKEITRYISTHPDLDHIQGLKYLDDRIAIVNFYCVNNEYYNDDTEDFEKYYSLRDDTKKAFYIFRGCKRKWMNQDDEEKKYGSSGINILWPITDNDDFLCALQSANDGGSPNNISPIIKYSLEDGVKILWFGDLENCLMEKIKGTIEMPKTDIIFAPHHGRQSGKLPVEWLEQADPQIIVVGEAPSKNLDYYSGYNTITQNSAGDITFECVENKTHIYVSCDTYNAAFLTKEKRNNLYGNYIGTINKN